MSPVRAVRSYAHDEPRQIRVDQLRPNIPAPGDPFQRRDVWDHDGPAARDGYAPPWYVETADPGRTDPTEPPEPRPERRNRATTVPTSAYEPENDPNRSENGPRSAKMRRRTPKTGPRDARDRSDAPEGRPRPMEPLRGALGRLSRPWWS